MTVLAVEPARPLPRICPCENGGTCSEGEGGAGGAGGAGTPLQCRCREPLQPPHCALAAAVAGGRAPGTAAVLVPVLLVLVVALAGAAAWFLIRKRPL